MTDCTSSSSSNVCLFHLEIDQFQADHTRLDATYTETWKACWQTRPVLGLESFYFLFILIFPSFNKQTSWIRSTKASMMN